MKKGKYISIWFFLFLLNIHLANNLNTGIFPSSFTASDFPWDHGDRIKLSWEFNDSVVNTIESYSIFKAASKFKLEENSSGDSSLSDLESFTFIESVNRDINEYIASDLNKDSMYVFKIVANYADGNHSSASFSEYISPIRNWFDGKRFPLFLITIIFSGK